MTYKELIKQEIEMLKHTDIAYDRSRFMLLLQIEDFIDSLPEEPVSVERINECLNWDKDWGCSTSPMNKCDTCPRAKWVEVKEEKKNYNERYKRIAQTEQFKESYCGKSLGKEEPVSEDLEEEISNYIKDNFFGSKSIGFLSNRTKGELDSIDVVNIARHFAKWQEKQMLGIAEA